MAKETEAHVIGKCKDCKYWMPETKFKGFSNLFGYCNNQKVLNSVMARGAKNYFFLNGILTDEDFGCIYFEREANGNQKEI